MTVTPIDNAKKYFEENEPLHRDPRGNVLVLQKSQK